MMKKDRISRSQVELTWDKFKPPVSKEERDEVWKMLSTITWPDVVFVEDQDDQTDKENPTEEHPEWGEEGL